MAAAVEGEMKYGSSNGSARRARDRRSTISPPRASASRTARRAHESPPAPPNSTEIPPRAARRRPAARRGSSTRPTARAAPGHARTGSVAPGGRAQPKSRRAFHRTSTSQGADDRASCRSVARSGPRSSRSPGNSAGGNNRCSVRVRESPSPKTIASKHLHRVDVERAASGQSNLDLARRCARGCLRRLAGNVAASFATTRSLGRSHSANVARNVWRSAPRVSITISLASAGRCVGRWAARMIVVTAYRSERCARSGRACDCGPPARPRVASATRAGRVGRIGATSPDRRRERKSMQRRVHVAGIDRQYANALGAELFMPDPAHLGKAPPCSRHRRPSSIRRDRCIADDVHHHAAPSVARRQRPARPATPSSAGRAEQVRRERAASKSSHAVSPSNASGTDRDWTRCSRARRDRPTRREFAWAIG